MNWTIHSVGTLGVAASLALVPLSGSADTLDQPYLVTTTTQTAAGTVSYRDIMIVHGRSAISADSAAVERDRSCYTILQHFLADGSVRKPYTIKVALDDDHVVPVPMMTTLVAPATGARLVQADGDADGRLVGASVTVPIAVHVDVRVLAQDGRLQAATLRESTTLQAPLQMVQVSGCAVQRLPQPQPISPA